MTLADVKFVSQIKLFERRSVINTQMQKKPEFIQTDECPMCGDELKGIALLQQMVIKLDGNFVTHCGDCACDMIHEEIMWDEEGQIVISTKNMEKLFVGIPRSHYVNYLDDYFYFIVKNCPELFGEIWTESEFVHTNLKIWKIWFKYIKDNKINVMTKDDKKVYDELSDEVTIYRGGVCEDGLSWTLSKKKAEWFRDRSHKKDAKVFKKTAKKSDIVAYFDVRKEKEIIYLEGGN